MLLATDFSIAAVKQKDIDDSEPKTKKSREKSIKPGPSPDEEQVRKLKV
jgi:hypothetical protein